MGQDFAPEKVSEIPPWTINEWRAPQVSGQPPATASGRSGERGSISNAYRRHSRGGISPSTSAQDQIDPPG
jgi:hypothetical protein